MNLLLLHAADRNGAHAVVSGRRAQHIRKVLKKGKGDSLRAALEGQGLTTATIVEESATEFRLSLSMIEAVEVPTIHLVLAVPRPKAVSRIVAAASSFGVASLTLINAWRVEKSYFDSPRLAPERLREDAILGCEQGQQCHVPQLSVERSFRRYFEDTDPGRHPRSARRIFLHPQAGDNLASCWSEEAPIGSPSILALGPEGGFIESELSSLRAAGYRAARLQTGPLKTEVALAATLGQVVLLQED